MQFCLPRSILKTALVPLRRIAGKKSGPPALRHLLIQVNAGADGCGTATFSSTNLETVLTFNTKVDEAVSGIACLPLDGLADALKGRGTKDPILIRVGKSSAEIRTPSTSRSGPLLALSSFPKLPPMPPLAPAPGVFFPNLLRASVFRSTDSSRPALNGVHMDHSGKTSCLVATDGHRLITLPVGKLPASLKKSATIPIHQIPSKVLESGSSLLAGCDKGRFGFQAGSWQGSVKLQDINFPAWRQVLPETRAKGQIDIPVNALEEIAAQLKALAVKKEQEEALALISDGRRLAVRYHESDTDKKRSAAIPRCSLKGQAVEAVVNRQFLLDALRSGFNTIRIADPQEPLDLRSQVAGERVVIMPLRHTGLTTPLQNRTKTRARTTARVPQSRKVQPMPQKTFRPKPPPINLFKEIQDACAAAKSLFREGANKVSEISTLSKQLARDQKHSASEVRAARQALAKLKSLSF